jgi:transposase
MANELKMDKVFAILTLHQAGWSDRRIARELGIHRGTVGRHLRLARATNPPAGSGGPSKPATNPPPGSDGLSKPATNPPTGSEGSERTNNGGFIALRPPAYEATLDAAAAEDRATLGSDPSATAAPNGTGGILTGAACLSPVPPPRTGPISDCEPYREIVLAKLSQGLSGQRIYQDLVADHGFASGYDSVKRFVRSLGKTLPLPFRRMECLPGDEAQVDFGTGAPIVDAEGHRRRPHVFRIVLSHSRKAYSEVVWREGTDEFLQCLENAFWHFGGVPRTIVPDNLKAAVKHADWYDPELQPKIESFCLHYGTVILPTKPYTPRHKGKVENGVGYVQENALKGHTFGSLEAENQHPSPGRPPWPTRVSMARPVGRWARSLRRWNGRRCCRCLPAGSRASRRPGGRCIGMDMWR